MGSQHLYPVTSILGGKRVVTDLKTDPGSPAYNYWATATHTGLAEAMSISIPNITGSAAKIGGQYFGRVYNSLKQQANNERKKEEMLLRQVGIDMNKIKNEADFIKVINLLTKNEAELEGELQRLLKIIAGYDTKGVSKGERHGLEQEYGSLARQLLPEMRRRTHQIAIKAAQQAVNDIKGDMDYAVAAQKAITTMRIRIQQQFDIELKEVVGKLYTKLYGDYYKNSGELQKRINEITQNLSEVSKYLINAMNLNSGLNNLEEQIKKAGSKKKAKKMLTNRKQLHMKATSKSAHGNLSETLMPILQTMGFNAYLAPGSTTIKPSVQSKRINTNVAKVDNVMSITTNSQGDVSLDNFANMSPKNLKDASHIVNNMLKHPYFDIENLNIVFMTMKDYKFSSIMKSGGFSGGGSRPIEDASMFSSKAGIRFGKEFYLLAYNTMNGAIAEARQPEIKEAIQNGVMAGVMSMLFDDSDTAGVGPGNLGKTNTLHIFNLNGINVPASYFLNAYAESLNNAKQLTSTGMLKVDVHMGSIKSESIGGSGYGAVSSAFASTANSAINANTFSIHFFGQFNNFVKGLASGNL